MTYEYAACEHTSFDDSTTEDCDANSKVQSQSVSWRRRAVSLCDVTWEPVCILKFLSEDCVFCEKKVLVTEVQLQKVVTSTASWKPGSDCESTESSDESAVEIIRSVQFKHVTPQGASLVVTPGDETAQNGVGIKSADVSHVCNVCKSPGGSSSDTHVQEGVTTVPIVLPISVGSNKPCSNLPSWGLLPPVEESEAEVESSEPETDQKAPKIVADHQKEEEESEPEEDKPLKTSKTKKLKPFQGGVEIAIEDETRPEKDKANSDTKSKTTGIEDYSSKVNDEILTRAYEVITENDDLLTALDKLEIHISEGTEPLADKKNKSSQVKADEESSQSKENVTKNMHDNTETKQDNVVGIVRKRNDATEEEKDEFGFVIKFNESGLHEDDEKEDSCDTKIPKIKKSTSGAKRDASPKSVKSSLVKPKEGNRLIRALNWVSKLPARISADKQIKKHENKRDKPGDAAEEKQEKNENHDGKPKEKQATPPKGDDDDYGFISHKPLSERQNRTLLMLPRINTVETAELKQNRDVQAPEVAPKEEESEKDETGAAMITEVLGSFQPEVDDTHFQDNLRRFENIALAKEKAVTERQSPEVIESQRAAVTPICELHFEPDTADDDWEPGPRQSGSLPNLAGAFLSTSPTMERIREYMMQDESDDSSLDEFLLIPMPTDYEETVAAANSPKTQHYRTELNSGDVYDSEGNFSETDVITSGNRCSDLPPSAESEAEKDSPLPPADQKLEKSSPTEHNQSSISEESADNVEPHPIENKPVVVTSGISQNHPIELNTARESKPLSVPRAIRGTHSNHPPYVTPPRSAKLAAPNEGTPRRTTLPQAPRGRSLSAPRRSGGQYGQRQPGNFRETGGNQNNSVRERPITKPLQHTAKPSQHVAGSVRTNPVCPRLSQQPGTNLSRGSIGFHQQPQHYIASHKPTNVHSVNSRVIHKGGFNRGATGNEGSRGSYRSSAPQKQGRNNISGGRSAGNSTPVLETDPDQSEPRQVKLSAGEPGSVQRVQARITLLPGGGGSCTSTGEAAARGKTTSSAHVSAHTRVRSHSPRSPLRNRRPLAHPEHPPGNRNNLQIIQDGGGSNNWMDSGVQMDFTDEN